MDLKAPRDYRVTSRKDIDRIFADGLSARDALMTVVAAPNELPHARCAVGVSKRHGTAVRRNRIKRLCREAFRLSRDSVPAGWDYMLIPRPGGTFTLGSLRASVEALTVRVARSRQGRPRP